MADLNNLLAELDGSQDDEILSQPPVEHDEEIDRDYEGVPEALKAAQERKNQYDDHDVDVVGQFDDELGATLNMSQDEDYARLKAAWIKELLCPELLPYDHDTISLEQELIEGQEETIDALTSTKNVDALVAHIYRLDVERTKFILSDLLVTRLNKLEAHALHNRTVLDRMSDNEVSHLKAYGELLEKHFHRTVLDHMPKEAWKKLDDPEMVETPDLNRFLFCKTLEDVEIGDQYHSKGSCLIARYGAIQRLVLEARIELLM